MFPSPHVRDEKRSHDLASEIARVLGRQEAVDTSPIAIQEHSYDCWPVSIKWRQQKHTPFPPDVIVRPESTTEVSTLLAWANTQRVFVTPWGLGSSVVGGPIAARGGICLDLSKLNRINKLNHEDLVVRAEAGVNGGTLENYLNELGLTLNHSPQSLHRSSLGGWVATHATGQFSSRYGGIEDLCAGIRGVLADGTVFDTGSAPRKAVGLDLRHMMIGSEGCLGVITEVALRVFRKAEHRELDTISFGSIEEGINACREIMQNGLRPFLLRLYDVDEARHAMGDKSFETPVMFLGCEGRSAIAKLELEYCVDICQQNDGRSLGVTGVSAWMERRFDFSKIESVLDNPGGVAETIEIANSWSGITQSYFALKSALASHADEVLGHFSHAYTNGISLYFIILANTADAIASEARLWKIWRTAMETAIATGATISHHHGIGLARSSYVARELGSAIRLLKDVKSVLDPNGILNPGKF
jgi:alkyldihydroxyacetonephosphate synthase